LGLARTTVVNRMARLERDGIIQVYGLRLGSELEQAAVCAYYSISVLPRSAIGVIRALEKMVEVEEVASVCGQFDYLALRCSTTHQKLDDLLDRIGSLDELK